MCTPSASLTDFASSIIALHRPNSVGSPIMRSRVAPVSALMGLKQTFPQSFTQMLKRMLSRTGASNPASVSAAASLSTRLDELPSGSPSVNRLSA